MENLENKVKFLENKVKILENALEMLNDMKLSKEINEYVDAKLKTLKFVDLINSLEESNKLNIELKRKNTTNIQNVKQILDNKIEQTLENEMKILNTCQNDTFNNSLFKYEKFKISITNAKKFPELNQYKEDGISISGYNGFYNCPIIIPQEMNGYKVVEVWGFGLTDLEKIILPKSIKMIGSGAFWHCKSLKNIKLPNETILLDKGCFQFSGLKEIILPDSVREIGCSSFEGCDELENVLLSENLVTIREAAFKNCISLKTLVFPEKIEYIHKYSFEGTAIKIFVFPKGLKTISSYAFGKYNSNCKKDIICVFLGKDTMVKCESSDDKYLTDFGTIYCLPGSNILKFARTAFIPVKPLNEFRMEDYL